MSLFYVIKIIILFYNVNYIIIIIIIIHSLFYIIQNEP
jgi:hypothetical protein